MKDYLRILEIEEVLEEANEHYSYTGEDFLIEEEYNMLMRELQTLDPKNKLLHTPQEVIVKSDEKVIHTKAMLSLEKVYSIADLKKWMKKVARHDDEDFVVMPKLDGIAARYEDGVLSTRGDGVNGENISHRIPLIEFYQEEYTGELVITDDKFKQIKENALMTRKSGEAYKNSRNAISGIMNSEYDFNWTENWKPVEFIPYDQINVISTIDKIERHIDAIRQGSKDLPTDGFVIRLEDDEYGESLGYTSHHYKHSIALKEASTTVQTTLESVEFQQARSHIGMVGLVEPVELGGVTIKRVSLHNMDIVKALDLKIGDMIEITRAGEVIPHITCSFGGGYEAIECTECPACGADVELDGQFWKCQNKDCEEKAINEIVSSAKKLGIKGIAKGTITKLFGAELIENIVDLVGLDTWADMSDVFAKGSKSYLNFFKEIIRIGKVEMDDFTIFGSWGVEGFGRSFFKKIFKEISFTDFMTICKEGDKIKLLNIPTISEIRAENLIAAFKDTQILDGLLNHFTVRYSFNLVKQKTGFDNKEKDMKGTICFTGKGFAGRKELTELAEAAGYEVAKSVTKTLGTLVCEDPSAGTTKLKKAAGFGTNVISYDEFQGMVA